MLLITMGIVIGFAWHWLITWSRRRGFRISWLVWALLILAVVDAVSGIQNYALLKLEYEEAAAANTIQIYAIQTLVVAVPALLLLWRQVRRVKTPQAAA